MSYIVSNVSVLRCWRMAGFFPAGVGSGQHFWGSNQG